MKKRVLQVNIDNNGGNGAFTLVQNFYGKLRDDYIFDYFTMDKFLEDEVFRSIIENGGKCYSANLRENKIKGHILLPVIFYKFLKSNKYEIVHIHSEVAYKQFLYALAAKLGKVDTIIIHSHSSNIDGSHKRVKRFFHYLLRYFVNMLGDIYIACSMPAAKWMFTRRNIESNRFHLLSNGIDPAVYKFSDEKRKKARTQLNLENKIVIGHVGALKWVKNQERLIDILHELNNDKYRLVLVGDGADKQKLISKAKKLGIENNVIFLGSRTDVQNLLQTFDIFVFPSFFEGIPMALIEAQAVGVPVIASDAINHDVKINDNCFFVSLDSTNEEWINLIMNSINNHIKDKGFINVSKSTYNIEKSINMLRKIYR